MEQVDSQAGEPCPAPAPSDRQDLRRRRHRGGTAACWPRISTGKRRRAAELAGGRIGRWRGSWSKDFTIHVPRSGTERSGWHSTQSNKRTGKPKRRHRIALQVIGSTDIPRFAGLNVIANFQALWHSRHTSATSAGTGPERSRWMYPIGSVVRANGPIAMGSDWNVSSLVPTGRDRGRDHTTGSEDDRGADAPRQATISDRLRAYTLGSARALV
jgi:hypothetical protein